MSWEIGQDLHLLTCTAVHIVDNMSQQLQEVGRHRSRHRTNLRKAVCDELQTLYVLVHLRYQRIIGIGLFQHLHPSD